MGLVNNSEVFTNVHIVNKTDDILVLSHGATSHAESFGALVPFLEDKNYVSLDLPGHFRSDTPHMEELDRLVDFIEDFITDLKETHNITDQKFVFLGHSMSGAIALELGRRKNENISGLVLLTTTSTFGDVITDELLESFNGKDNLEFYKLGFSEKTPEQAYEFLITTLHLVSDESKFLDFKMLSHHDVSEHLKDIEVPTLVIEAADDRIIGAEHQKTLVTGIKNSKHVILNNCGHFCVAEAPEALADEVTTFMDKLKG